MHIPHHLTRCRTSGRWSFRQRVPSDLQRVLDRRVIKRTLRTGDLPEAKFRAVLLATGYARLFTLLRDQRVDKLGKKDADDLVARLTASRELRDLTLHRTRTPDGIVTERWQLDDEKDVHLFRSMQAIYAKDPLLEAVQEPAPASRSRTGQSRVEPMSLSKARDAWLATIKASTLPKTYTIKKTAIDSLVRFLGETTQLATIHRSDLAAWYQHMREEGASTPTLTNKQSYAGGKSGFFDWAMASGYYPKGDNPAAGHISYSTREKRSRRKLGFKAYDRDQIKALFAPEALRNLSPSARWAALLGLYTGARASEVGQLLVSDVVEEDGILCIRISDDGPHQKVKTDVSLRTVPIHTELLGLGFKEWVDSLKATGSQRLFPAAKADAKNGPGNWISKAFSRHLAQTGNNWPKAKRGFHSLRKSFIQELQGAGVVSELRAQIVGHELDDEHHATYSRVFTIREKLEGLGVYSPGLKILSYGLETKALRQLLKQY